MKTIKNVLFFLTVVVVALYRATTKKTYYISGTGIDPVMGRRMWFKTVFHTHGNVLPLHSIEEKMKEHMGFDTCIIIFFQRIPNSMAQYISADYKLEEIKVGGSSTRNKQ